MVTAKIFCLAYNVSQKLLLTLSVSKSQLITLTLYSNLFLILTYFAVTKSSNNFSAYLIGHTIYFGHNHITLH